MKSPWRLIADLASRRKPISLVESEGKVDHKGPTIDLQAQIKPSRELTSPVAPAATGSLLSTASIPKPPNADMEATLALPEILADAFEIPEPVQESAIEVKPVDPETDNGNLRIQAKVVRRTPAPRQAKRVPLDVAAQEFLDNQRLQTLNSAEAPEVTVLDKMASLQDDIQTLRIQLAQKLHLQNAQLKKMLERFDRVRY